MTNIYQVDKPQEINSPALIVFRDIVKQNIRQMIAIAGDAKRLCPHCKTHKMPEVTKLELQMGIVKQKCATIAEAEMLADAGVEDIFLAYNLVGPNIARAMQFLDRYPKVRLAVTADHELAIAELGKAAQQAEKTIDVLLDLDVGQHRTGVEPGPRAVELYRQIVETNGLNPGGLHVYDGQNHQTSVDERRAAILACWKPVAQLRDELVANGWPVPRIVTGGTGQFPIWASIDDPTIEPSPGTCIFQDIGYQQMFPDLEFTPAALLLTRVISLPTADRITLDLGYKACASDPPAGKRLYFPRLPDAVEVLQNEEHLVLQTNQSPKFKPGDHLLAIPRHICPTSALHKQAYVVSEGNVVDRWEITARDRQLTI